MPRVRQMNLGEVDMVGLWIAQSQISALKQAFAEGKNVQIEESSFSDPNDYVQVLVDGKPFTYIPGY